MPAVAGAQAAAQALVPATAGRRACIAGVRTSVWRARLARARARPRSQPLLSCDAAERGGAAEQGSHGGASGRPGRGRPGGRGARCR